MLDSLLQERTDLVCLLWIVQLHGYTQNSIQCVTNSQVSCWVMHAFYPKLLLTKGLSLCHGSMALITTIATAQASRTGGCPPLCVVTTCLRLITVQSVCQVTVTPCLCLAN